MPTLHRRDLMAVLPFVCLIFLAFFRAKWAFTNYGGMSDRCYYNILLKFFGEAGLNCTSNSYPLGTSITWIPAALAAKMVAFVTPYSFQDWLPAFVGTWVFLMWATSLYVFFQICKLLFKNELSEKNIFAIFLGIPLIFYATQRTSMSHAPEFLFCALFFLALIQKKYFPSLLLGAFCILIRFSNAPLLLILWAAVPPAARMRNFNRLAGISSVAVLVFCIYLLTFRGYNGDYLKSVVPRLTLANLSHFLFGADFGIVWTAPWWLFIFIAGFIYQKKISWMARACLAWMLALFVLCWAWRGHGSDFGYRYLIGSYLAALYILFELSAINPWLLSTSKVLSYFAAIWTSYCLWIYRTTDDLTPILTELNYNIPNFQLLAIKYLTHFELMIKNLRLSPVGSIFLSQIHTDNGLVEIDRVEAPALYVLILITFFCVGVIFYLSRQSKNLE
jgi:hypothetical protein